MSTFEDKILLITGGTGSFGNAVLRRFLDSDIKEIRIFSRDEKKQDDMRHQLQNSKVKFYIGNVRDRQSVDEAMNGVDYVFAAAALKQVPSCEFFPLQAVQTNVIGTDNVLESAIAHGVKNVVVLSTDKAAYPINAMGISKAMMEKVAIAKGRALGEGAMTIICCTRYGNVMAMIILDRGNFFISFFEILVIIQISVITRNPVIFSHVYRFRHLFPSYQCLVKFFPVTGSYHFHFHISLVQLFQRLCKYIQCCSWGFLNKQIPIMTMLESVQN